METAGQNAKQVMEENDALKQLIELLNQQDMKEQSQDFMGVFWYVAGMQVQLAAMVDYFAPADPERNVVPLH
jgi:hypothetical protein